MRKHRGAQYSDALFYSLLFLFCLFCLSFFKMMINTGDNPAHLKIVNAIFSKNPNYENYIHILAYPLYHIVTKIISFVCLNDIKMAAVCVLTIANLTSAIVIRRILNDICKEADVFNRYLLDILAICFLFFETLAGPLTDGRIYASQCGPNPWHNPTIIFVRPIGLVAMYFFVKCVNDAFSDVKIKYILVFSACSVLSVLAKPNFMMVFFPAFFIFVLFYCYKKNCYFVGITLLSLVPTLALLLFQFCFFQFYNSGTVSPVKFLPGGFSEFSFFDIFKVCLATFPIPIIGVLLYRDRIFDSVYSKIGYISLLFGTIEMFFFTNGNTGDFSWGYDLAVGFLTITTLGMSLKIKDAKWKRWPLFCCFMYQVIIGFYYVVEIYRTGNYWF